MARSVYSPSPSPSLRSSTDFSDSSADEDVGSYGEGGEYGASASRPGSPLTAEASMLGEDQEADTMTCQWEDCGRVFNHLPTLIDHIHNGESPSFALRAGPHSLQTILVSTSRTTPASGQGVYVAASPKRPASPSSRTYAPIQERSPSRVRDQVSHSVHIVRAYGETKSSS